MANLDEAIEWAERIPTACKGQEGCVEIRPMRGIRVPARAQAAAESTEPEPEAANALWPNG